MGKSKLIMEFVFFSLIVFKPSIRIILNEQNCCLVYRECGR